MVSKSVLSSFEDRNKWPTLEINNPAHYVGRFFGKDYHGGPSKGYRGLIRNEMWLMILPKDSPI